ncbi:GntR family transcriptional regulator [Mesobacillus subterraneus]|jgi:GntR family transcriptional regulator|uniref:GntR family transcriptional regulator n=1 Tax=Mesobacillus subterraneus TaxID=285983 RepID=UPI00203BFBAB|nr:GntR family transcriptional regulator [Mesobacillus subterraneus]MCM3666284.1 GntR family transcriptional regulator [Mesobacillus subterraneus]MCM3685283.1 GntR family transcriptional regulator [Mesobacillus subterraneus]
MRKKLISSSSMPLYKNCAMILRQQILDGKWDGGQKLPSESQLTSEFNASRITIRQAMQLLENEGLITRFQGKGTFVTNKSIEQSLTGIHDFAKNLNRVGRKPSFVIENNSVIACNNFLSRSLDVEVDSCIYRIERLKLDEGTPMIFERLFLPCDHAPELAINELSQKWLSEILSTKYNLPITKVRQTIEPIIIGDYEAEKLGIAAQSLGLLIDRISWSNEKAVLLTRSIIRGDMAKFVVEVGGQFD